MRLAVCPTQMIGTDMGVDLGCRQRRMPENLLHAAEIGSTVQKPGGSAVAKSVRADFAAGSGRVPMHDAAHHTRIDSSSTCAEEQRRTTLDRKSTRLNSSHVSISYA